MALRFPLILFALLNVLGHKSQTVSWVVSFLPTRARSQEKLISEHPENTSHNTEFLFSAEKAQF